MKIDEFFIGNFRSLHRKTIRFERLNVFVGSNNSGKTNIIMALRFFSDPYMQTSINDLNRKIQSKTISLKASITFSDKGEKKFLNKYEPFPKLIKRNSIILERRHKADEEAKYYSYSGNKRLALRRGEVSHLRRFFRRYFLFADVLSDENINFNNLDQAVGNIQIRHTSQYVKDNFERQITPAFRDFNRNINNLFAPLRTKFHVQFNLPEKNFAFKVVPDITEMLSNIQLEINQNDLDHYLKNKGQGIKNVSSFIFSGMFNYRKYRLVAVEEPEIHLHPSLTRNLVDSIKNTQSNKQFFITTHSTNVIDHLDPRYIKRVLMRDGMTHIVTPKVNEKVIIDFFKFVFQKHAECLLAKRVIIAEGLTEVRALPALSRKVSIKKQNASIPASLDINEIQIVQVEGGAFHGPVPFLDAFKIDWLILGDGDKWPIEYMKTIKKLGMDRIHPRKYNYLRRKQSQNAKLTKDIRLVLYEYFNIICLPKRFEDLLLSVGNAGKIRNILKSYMPERYKDVYAHNKGLSDIDLCKEIMSKRAPQWSILIGRELPGNLVSDGIISLLKLLVNRPQYGAI